MNRLHLPNRAFANQPGRHPILDCGVALIAHLRNNALRLRPKSHLTTFPNGVRKRLLAINMLPALHGENCRERVHMIRGRHGDGVDRVPQLLEHLTEVLEVLYPGRDRVGPFERTRIDIAERHMLCLRMGRDVMHVVVAHAVEADRRHLHAAVWRR